MRKDERIGERMGNEHVQKTSEQQNYILLD